LDFTTERSKRRLFPNIEPTDVPGASAEVDRKIFQAIAHLHQTLLGQNATPEDEDVKRTFDLFAGIVADARMGKIEPMEIYTCRGADNQRVADPHYTVRAWRGVVTYLLRRPEFLYE
jgi:hypothetical protein